MYHNLQKILKKKFGGDSTLIGDEGGFAPPCDCRSGLELVVEAIEQAPRSRRDRAEVHAEIAPRRTLTRGRRATPVSALSDSTWRRPSSRYITTKRGPIAIQNVA